MKPPFEECWDKIGAAVNEAMKAGVPPPSVVMILEMTKTEVAMEHIQRLKFQMQMQQAKAMANEADKSKIITGK